MKKIIIVLIVCFSFIPVSSFAELTARQVIEKTWQGRRLAKQENTLWRVQDYVQVRSCSDIADLSCYKAKGAEKHLAQSLQFDEGGKDGVWMHFFAPKKMKNKGVAIILKSDLKNASVNYCRGRLDNKKGPRQIVPELSEHIAVDSAINSSWIMVMLQTGIEIFSEDLFKYKFTENNVFGFPNSEVYNVEAVSVGDLPGYTVTIDKEHFSIRGINFNSYIVENFVIDYGDGKWSPAKIFIWNSKKRGTLLIRDNKLRFNKWQKSFTKSSLPYGK